MIEVDRPNRQARRRSGKSDPADAIEAARAALSGRARAVAKTADGRVEAIRALVVARRSNRDCRIKTLNQIRQLSLTAPDDLRERLRGVPREHLAETAAALRPRPEGDPILYATKLSLRTLGRRAVALEDEAVMLDAQLGRSSLASPPSSLASTASVSTPPPSCWSRPGTTPSASAPKQRGRTCAEWRRCRRRQGR